ACHRHRSCDQLSRLRAHQRASAQQMFARCRGTMVGDAPVGLKPIPTITQSFTVPVSVAVTLVPPAILSSNIENPSVPRDVYPLPTVVEPPAIIPIAATSELEFPTAKLPVLAVVPDPLAEPPVPSTTETVAVPEYSAITRLL